MDDWQTYRLEDLIPVTPPVYWRLLERVNEAAWPLHVVMIALGMAALFGAWRGRTRVALMLAAPAWLVSGIVFHFRLYAELHWAAPWFGAAFVLQAALLVTMAVLAGDKRFSSPAGRITDLAGGAIAAGAIFVYPLIAVAIGAGPSHSEWYGLHPEPTAIATLGILVLALGGPATWLALVIPVVWCLMATLSLLPLGAPWAWLPLCISVIVVGLFCIPPRWLNIERHHS